MEKWSPRRDEPDASRKWNDRLYWALIGILTSSLVWLPVARSAWSDEDPSSSAVNTASVAGATTSSSASTPGTEEPEESPMAAMPGMDESDGEEPGDGQDAGAATDALSSCRQVYLAQTSPLRQVTEPMDQWQIHVGAMNKLVLGAITLAQAQAFWNSTRVGAMSRLDAFRTSYGDYQRRTVRCPRPEDGGDAGPLEACERVVLTRGRVLAVAHRALDTWGHHIMHMEMLRKGEMSPARATALWLASWRAGQRQIDDYRRVRRSASGGC